MVTPSKSQTLEYARRIELEDIVRKGFPALTPEDYELRESGAIHKARRQLMSGPKSEMEKYLQDMASEVGFSVLPKRELKRLERIERRRQIQVEPNGNSIMYLARALFPRKMVVAPKPKARRHIQRTSKTMRTIRKRVRDGQKVFSFPDHIWKVRK